MTPARVGRGLVVAVVVTAGVIAGCSGDDGGGLPGDSSSEGSTSIETTTTEALQLERRDAGFALPVALVAGDVRFDVTAIEFSNATPGTFSETEPDLLEDELLYVTFTAQVDPAAGEGAAYEWPPKSFQIVTGSGRTVSGSGVDYAASVEATTAGPTAAAVVFPVGDDEISGARFRFDDGSNPPVEVALPPAGTAEPAGTAPPPSAG